MARPRPVIAAVVSPRVKPSNFRNRSLRAWPAGGSSHWRPVRADPLWSESHDAEARGRFRLTPLACSSG